MPQYRRRQQATILGSGIEGCGQLCAWGTAHCQCVIFAASTLEILTRRECSLSMVYHNIQRQVYISFRALSVQTRLIQEYGKCCHTGRQEMGVALAPRP